MTPLPARFPADRNAGLLFPSATDNGRVGNVLQADLAASQNDIVLDSDHVDLPHLLGAAPVDGCSRCSNLAGPVGAEEVGRVRNTNGPGHPPFHGRKRRSDRCRRLNKSAVRTAVHKPVRLVVALVDLEADNNPLWGRLFVIDTDEPGESGRRIVIDLHVSDLRFRLQATRYLRSARSITSAGVCTRRVMAGMGNTEVDPHEDHYRKLERMYLSAPLNDFYRPAIHVEGGRSEITIPVKEELFHAASAVHGSVYFKMLDDAAWFAVNSLLNDEFVLTTTFTVYLTRPVSSGSLRSAGYVVNEGRTRWIAEAVAYDGDDREIGRGSGSFVKSGRTLGPDLGYE